MLAGGQAVEFCTHGDPGMTNVWEFDETLWYDLSMMGRVGLLTSRSGSRDAGLLTRKIELFADITAFLSSSYARLRLDWV